MKEEEELNKKEQMEPVEAPAEESDEATHNPNGRSFFLDRMKKRRPDYAPADDEQFLNDIRDDVNKDGEELEGYRGTNKRLSYLIDKDPRFGALISLMNEGKSSEYAIAKIYGKDLIDLDDKGLEDLEAGYKEHLSEVENSEKVKKETLKNIQAYKDNLQTFAKDNGLDDTQLNDLSEAIYTDATNFLNGIIPIEFIDYKWKGMNYESDVKEAADAGMAEARNQRIDATKKKMKNIPDLNSSAGVEKKKAADKRGSFFDGF